MSRYTRHLSAAAAVAVLIFPAAASAAPAPIGAQNHTTLTGATFNQIAPVGDVNGDGRDDLAAFTSCGARVSVVFGAASPGTVDVSVPGPRVLAINGLPTAGDTDCGRRVTGVGDVNGDGRSDIVVQTGGGSFGSDVPMNTAHVVYGRAAGAIDVGTLGSAGLTLTATAPGLLIKLSNAAKVGDVNGDGRADIGLEGYISSEQPALSLRRAVGVVFGRAGGGTVNLGSSTLSGLIITSTTAAAPNGYYELGQISAAGDANRDGRADIIVNATPMSRARHLVYGRAASGIVDISNLGAGGVRLPGEVVTDADLAPVGDLNGDGLEEQYIRDPASQIRPTPILLSSPSAPVFDLWAVARRLSLTASLGSGVNDVTGVGDRTGDGRADLVATATYTTKISTPYLYGYPEPLRVGYLVAGRTGAATIDVRTAAPRIGGFASTSVRNVGLRFTGSATQELALLREDGRVVVQTLTPTAPADTTAPSLTMGFDRPVISGGCSTPCYGLDTSSLNYTLGEDAYVELTVSRGTSVIGTATGSTTAGAGAYDFYATLNTSNSTSCFGGGALGAVCSRLPAGTYTATMRATDLAGNRSASRTASVVVR